MPDPVFSHTRRHVVSVVMVIIHHFHGDFGKVMESLPETYMEIRVHN